MALHYDVRLCPLFVARNFQRVWHRIPWILDHIFFIASIFCAQIVRYRILGYLYLPSDIMDFLMIHTLLQNLLAYATSTETTVAVDNALYSAYPVLHGVQQMSASFVPCGPDAEVMCARRCEDDGNCWCAWTDPMTSVCQLYVSGRDTVAHARGRGLCKGKLIFLRMSSDSAECKLLISKWVACTGSIYVLASLI